MLLFKGTCKKELKKPIIQTHYVEKEVLLRRGAGLNWK
jgi:hypothetical protein